MKDILYLGVNGSLVAIERKSGRELWRRDLKGRGFVTVVLDGDILVAHTRGELFGLDPLSGAVLWRNGLEGLGYGYVTMASTNISSHQTAAPIKQMVDEQS